MEHVYDVDSKQKKEILNIIKRYLTKGLIGCLAIPIIAGLIFGIGLYIVGGDIQYSWYALIVVLVVFFIVCIRDTYMYIRKFLEYNLLKKTGFGYSLVEADALLLDTNLFRFGKYNLNIIKYHYNWSENKAFSWDGPAMRARNDMRLVVFVPYTGNPDYVVYPMFRFEHVLVGD